MLVLDTNILSELMRPAPARSVVEWFGSQETLTIHITAVTAGEMLLGVAIMPEGRRKLALSRVMERLFAEHFDDKVLPFDESAARVYSRIMANRRALGRPIGQSDAQIAGIVASRGAALATRNTSDFADCGVRLVNPFQDSAS